MNEKPKMIRAYCSAHEWEHEPMLEERYFYSEDRRHLLALHDLQIYDLPYGSGEVEIACLPRDGENVGDFTPRHLEIAKIRADALAEELPKHSGEARRGLQEMVDEWYDLADAISAILYPEEE